jgi:hypothetical protein
MLGSRRGRNSQLYALNSRCEIDRPHLLGRNSRTQREERKADITKEAHLTCASTKMYSHHDCTMEPRFDQREAFRANHRPTGPNVSQITPTSELATIRQQHLEPTNDTGRFGGHLIKMKGVSKNGSGS